MANIGPRLIFHLIKLRLSCVSEALGERPLSWQCQKRGEGLTNTRIFGDSVQSPSKNDNLSPKSDHYTSISENVSKNWKIPPKYGQY